MDAASQIGAGAAPSDQMPPAAPEGGMEDEGGAAGGSFFIPADMLGGKTFQAGDELTIKVIGHDQDGDLEATMVGGGEGEGAAEGGDWRSELHSKLSENQGNAAQ